MREILSKLVQKSELTEPELTQVVRGIRDDVYSAPQMAAFLMGLVMKGVTPREVVAIVRTMRDNSVRLIPEVVGSLTDTCGTGGGLPTFNVSTANSIVSAAAGVKVAKHGSRSISAKTGSADVLEALGMRVELPPQCVAQLVESIGFTFLYAPYFHPIMMKVYGPEAEIGIKSVFFTVIGPLINPAGARRHVLGVFRNDLFEVVAEAARSLDYEHLLVVHGVDGLDEISILGESRIAEIRGHDIRYYQIRPEDLGLRRASFEEIRGGDPQFNARIILDIFRGADTGARRDFLLANAAASLLVSSKVSSLDEGISLAREVIDSGKAMGKLREIVDASRRIAP